MGKEKSDGAAGSLFWREVAARAATLEERHHGTVLVVAARTGSAAANAEAEAVADARLTRWRETAARGDAGRFADVLSAHGLTDEAAAHRLLAAGPVRLPPGAPLPAWARTARRIVAARPGGRVPTAVIGYAREWLRRRVGPVVYAGLSRRAHAALEARLSHRLAEAEAAPREVERCVRRALAGSDRVTPRSTTPSRVELFRHYPVLARVTAELVSDWVSAQAEFLRRLHRDRSRLAIAFFPGADDLGPVRTLDAGVSDEHHGGRTVLRLRFAHGRRLVYKPRDLGPEQVWGHLVRRWNAAAAANGVRAAPRLRAARVLARGRNGGTHAYGWMEWVPSVPRRGRTQRALYARRAGALLCLFHVLGGTDGHAENLVAAGTDPVLVDAETLAHPPPPAFPGGSARTERLTRSVLRTFLVPVPAAFFAPPVASVTTDDDEAAGGIAPQSPVANVWTPPAGFERWRRPRGEGTEDDDEPVSGSVLPPRRLRLDVPRRELLAGFRAAGRVLASSPAGKRWRAHARRTLADRPVRRVRLPTTFYAALRRRSVAAHALRDGVDRDLELEWLRRTEGTTSRAPTGNLRAEIRALQQLDIPRFVAPARLPDDAPWLAADDASLAEHLGAQADLLLAVLSGNPAPARA